MKVIKYIGIYDIMREGKLKRDCSLAATKKMDYIIDALNRCGNSVQIVSIARNKESSQRCSVEECKNDRKKNQLILAPSIGSKCKIISAVGELEVRIWLLIWLIIHTHKNENILVYHSQRLMIPVYIASKIKHFRYFLEVEELYYKFGFCSKRMARNEKKVIMNANALIVSTENIVKELGYHKKAIYLHGNYQNLRIHEVRENDEKEEKKVVFSGGIETVRNTAFNVCDCAEWLDDQFTIYLLGYGDKNAIIQLQTKIEKINRKLGKKKLIYCGTKTGNDYDRFMSSCDIAINFQNMDEYYMKFAFPSKVLNYLNYGLTVVTTPLDSIRNSEIDQLVQYPENMENTPKAFAMKINSLNVDRISEVQKKENEMDRLNQKFVLELSNLIDSEE